ncbi:MAG: type II toxin-antitoxin system RelE/ParE family toxin [Lentimicrobium sp.]|jgi:plasmid stabilization system protein ParE|nr:type II toxin-antitoxin system RelE/ParE family toxin [Lentimicrobium sp.]
MKKYKVNIDPEALADIQEITEWYNEQKTSLGNRFQKTVIRQINSLHKDPQIYAIRYHKIRCVIIDKFPFMIHFYCNDKSNSVEVLAVISTDRDPKIWEEKVFK